MRARDGRGERKGEKERREREGERKRGERGREKRVGRRVEIEGRRREERWQERR